MEKNKIQSDGEISNEDLEKVAGGANAVEYGLITPVIAVARGKKGDSKTSIDAPK